MVTTAPLQGTRVVLGPGRTTLGRQADCDGVLDDPTVSRHHAVIEQRNGDMTVRDLGSRNGTALNGRPVSGAVLLRDGDLIAFGSVEARFETAGGGRGGDMTAASPRPGEFHVGHQAAGQINNVARDQYVQHIRAERESFLADVAATKTRGRRLITFGFICLIAGFAIFACGIISFIQSIPGLEGYVSPSDAPSLFGPEIGGVPVGIAGFALGAVGSFAIVAGLVLHVSAAARLRKLQNAPRPDGGPPQR
jgi:hypothetical protein